MDAERYQTLLNRELDGLITPEEEAELMDRVSKDPELAAEHAAQHEIRRAFQSMEQPSCPDGLATRIADRILAAPQPIPFWRSASFFRAAAAVVICTTLAGLIGYHMGQNGEGGVDIRAHSEELPLDVKGLGAAWKKLGADDDTILKVVGVDLRYEKLPAPRSQAERDRRERLHMRDKLAVLPPDVRRRFCREIGMSEAKAQEFLRLKD